jgi:hypothetical protein
MKDSDFNWCLAPRLACYHDHVLKALPHSSELPEMHGCHLALDEDIGECISTCVHERATKSTTVTGRDVREHLAVYSTLAVIRGSVNLFIDHHKEAQRFDEKIRSITQFVRVPSIELVFDLGEVRIYEWDDR